MTFTHIPIDTPKMKRVTHNGTRHYVIDGEQVRYPSVTNVLSINNDWVKKWIERVGVDEAKRIQRLTSQRGTHIHKLAENYLRNEIVKPDIFYMELWASLRKEINKIDNIRLLEKYLYSRTLQVAGTPDVIADYDGVLSAVDFKTSSKGKIKNWITNYFIQTAVAAQMFQEHSGIAVDDIVVIIAVEHRDKPQVFKEKKDKYLEKFSVLREQFREKHGY